MKLIKRVQQEEVWNHWKKVERIPDSDIRWREDIRSLLPNNLMWYLAEIEKEDIGKIFIISSDDWKNITQTFRLVDTVKSLESVKDDNKVKNILEKKKIYQGALDGLDRRFILVTPSIDENFTLIEGNKRAVALLSINKLVGNQIYLGISSQIRNYHWARYTNVEDVEPIAAWMDFYSDKADAHASFFLASLFGLFAILAIAQTDNNAIVFSSGEIPHKILWTIPYWLLFLGSLHTYGNFRLYSSYAHNVGLTIEPQIVVGAREGAKEGSAFLRGFQEFKNMIGRVSLKVIGSLYLLIAFLCCGLAMRWDVAIFWCIVVAALIFIFYFLLVDKENCRLRAHVAAR